MRFLGRWLRRALLLLVLLSVVSASPILYIEKECRVANPPAPAKTAFAVDDPAYQRAEGDSYLSYPEWYIVHIYADLAAVTRQKSESSFDYITSIFGFWRSLCANTQVAESRGPVSFDQRSIDYVIGASFSVEMLVIGGYERTIGALSAAARGDARTAEDAFALKVADDFAASLGQTPWYMYPFFPALKRFWAETPFGQGSWVRSLERRVALTLEYGGKGLYAIPIGAMAGTLPPGTSIQSVIMGLEPSDFSDEPRLHKLRDLGGGATLVETQRYQELTDILVALAAKGRQVAEIGGAKHVLTTIVGAEAMATPGDGRPLFSLPIQSAPGQRRFGVDVDVRDLSAFIFATQHAGARFEHVYDP